MNNTHNSALTLGTKKPKAAPTGALNLTPRNTSAAAAGTPALAPFAAIATGTVVTKTQPADEDLAQQALPGHGIPSQDPNPAAQMLLAPGESQREARSALVGGGAVAGLATGAALGVAVAGPLGILVGATVGAVAGALGAEAAGQATKTAD